MAFAVALGVVRVCLRQLLTVNRVRPRVLRSPDASRLYLRDLREGLWLHAVRERSEWLLKAYHHMMRLQLPKSIFL